MEPMELNGGRFYLRPLLADDRVDDTSALEKVFAQQSRKGAAADSAGSGSLVPAHYVHHRRNQWLTGTAFTWAVCEQTQVELLAEAILIPEDGFLTDEGEACAPNHFGVEDFGADCCSGEDGNPPPPRATRATLSVRPAGDVDRVLPNDPVLTPKTVGDAVQEAKGTIQRWAEGYLGLQVRVVEA